MGSRLLRRTIDAALVALVVLVLIGVALGRIVPMTGRQTLVIGGGSMEPAIHLGDAVVVDPVAPSALAVGDIVSMRVGSQNAVFTHRITRLIPRPDGLWLETKGDANASVDPSIVPAAAIIGKVTVEAPYAGYLIKFLSVPVGVLFVLCLAGLLFALAWLLETTQPSPRRTQPIRRRRALGA